MQQYGYGAPRDPWDGMDHVDVSNSRLPRVPEGKHLLKVIRVTAPKEKVAVIVEFVAMQSNNPALQPGTQCSVYISSQYSDSLKRDVKRALCAIAGFDPKNDAAMAACSPFATALTRSALSEANPLQGRQVVCEGFASGRVSKRDGQPYFNYNWAPAEAPMNLQALPQPAPQPPPQYAPQPSFGAQPQPQPFGQPAPFALGGFAPAPQAAPAQPFAPPQQFAPQPGPTAPAFGPAAPTPAAGPPGWVQLPTGQWVQSR